MGRLRWLASFLVLVLTASAGGLAAVQETKTPAEPTPRYETRKEHDPNGIGKFYMGREIAHVMGHEAAGWLERPEREQEEEPTKLLNSLKLKPGDVVADIGAGSGYLTFRIAERIGPKGKVLAIDVQPEMLALIRQKMKARQQSNIEPILGTETDPKLPGGTVDLILMVDVYHEFAYPWEMTQAMVRSLKPDGRLVFVEYRLEDPKVWIKLVHKMAEKQVLKEMAPHLVRWVETLDTLPSQHVIIFKKDGQRSKEAKGREKRLNRLLKSDAMIGEVRADKKIRLSLNTDQRAGDRVLSVKELSKGFGQKKLFEDLKFEIRRVSRRDVMMQSYCRLRFGVA